MTSTVEELMQEYAPLILSMRKMIRKMGGKKGVFKGRSKMLLFTIIEAKGEFERVVPMFSPRREWKKAVLLKFFGQVVSLNHYYTIPTEVSLQIIETGTLPEIVNKPEEGWRSQNEIASLNTLCSRAFKKGWLLRRFAHSKTTDDVEFFLIHFPEKMPDNFVWRWAFEQYYEDSHNLLGSICAHREIPREIKKIKVKVRLSLLNFDREKAFPRSPYDGKLNRIFYAE